MMAKSLVKCLFCDKEFLKDNHHINENRKFGHRIYCSSNCSSLARINQIRLICENQSCKKEFKRQPSDISDHNYCSSSCAAVVNNMQFRKRLAVIRKCHYCSKRLSSYRKYCSSECKSNALTICEKDVIVRIRNFYKKHGRIPVKRETWGIYKPARKYFGTWNNAIKTAGFKPNPILFADHQIANDGHICHSIAEKVIDDYLFEKGIAHERNTPYPEGEYSADFKIGIKWFEYFGLAGEHKRYDELKKIKQKMAKRYKLNLIEIYPKDLYPRNRLEAIFGS